MKYIILFVITLVFGVLSGYLLRPFIENPVKSSWDRVKGFKEHESNPDNWNKNGDYADLAIPETLDVDIALLLAKGEIKSRRVFIPEVPNTREYILMWMQESSEDIIQISSVGHYQKGEIPLFFEIWYRPSYEERLELLIEEIKQKHKENQMEKK